jgi:lactose/L-arabinose transport system substrate-binding protein
LYGTRISRRRYPLMKRILLLVVAVMLIGNVFAFGEDLEGHLTVWTWTAKSFDFIFPAFQKLHPKVTLEVVPMSHPDTHDKAFTAIATGTGAPDFLTIDSAYIQKFIDQGGLVDMTSFMKPLQDKFPAFKIANDSDQNGNIFAVPYDCGPVGLYYQKAIFDTNKLKLPETWDEFIAVGKTLKKKGIYMLSVSIAGAAMDASLHGEVGTHALLTQQQGGSYFDSQMKPTINTPESITAMKLIKRFVDEGITANVAQGSPEQYKMFSEGKIATVISAAWYVNVLNNFIEPSSAAYGNWRLAKLPAFRKGGVRASNLGGSELVIPKQTPPEKRKLAMAFIEFACASMDGASAHADYGEFPAYLPVYPTDIIQQKTFPMLGDQKVYKLLAEVTPTIPNTWRIPPQYDEVTTIIQAEMNNILTGKVTVEEGLAKAQQEASR